LIDSRPAAPGTFGVVPRAFWSKAIAIPPGNHRVAVPAVERPQVCLDLALAPKGVDRFDRWRPNSSLEPSREGSYEVALVLAIFASGIRQKRKEACTGFEHLDLWPRSIMQVQP
jgi:hypothetical protein